MPSATRNRPRSASEDRASSLFFRTRPGWVTPCATSVNVIVSIGGFALGDRTRLEAPGQPYNTTLVVITDLTHKPRKGQTSDRRDRPESAEEVKKSWDDLRDGLGYLPHGALDRFQWHRNIAERYKGGRLHLHLHFATVESGRDVWWCLECRAAADDSGPVTQELAVSLPKSDPGLNDEREDTCQGSVFVLIYEMVQPAHRLIASDVRLNRLDHVNRRCGDLSLLKTVQTITIPVVGGRGRDREGRQP